MSELRTIVVDARTAEEAQGQARQWARAEPRIRLRTITRVRPTAGVDEWAVELAIETDQQEAECESTRGEWGEICPDCGQRLPSLPGPLQARVPAPSRRPKFAFGIGRP